MEPVRSHRNPRVVEAARLHRARARRQTGHTLIEGPNLLAEALSSGVVPRRVFALADDERSIEVTREQGIDLVRVDERALGRLAGTANPRGPVAEIAVRQDAALEAPNVLVSWGVGDPGNVGTLIRTASAFGWDFAYAAGTADPWSPKVLRSGAGGQFRVKIVEVTKIDDLHESGFNTVATVVSGGVEPDRLPTGRQALLVGEEAHGLPEDIVAQCDETVTIPMPGGAESLNAAAAAAIVVYAITNRRDGDPMGSNLPPT